MGRYASNNYPLSLLFFSGLEFDDDSDRLSQRDTRGDGVLGPVTPAVIVQVRSIHELEKVRGGLWCVCCAAQGVAWSMALRWEGGEPTQL